LPLWGNSNSNSNSGILSPQTIGIDNWHSLFTSPSFIFIPTIVFCLRYEIWV
jgi:hypothetical protein